ncbi:MAG: class I SAM-dependent methyltransferase, partial [Gemmatimonadota bacterium]|nr:class I SAM-dependent methyltransferase [Gemmatimonadota bacterium]
FSEYAYFSSYSRAWLDHACAYVDRIVPRLGLGRNSQVVELGSNDGYLLQYFVEKAIPVLGIDPARNVAEAAIGKGVPTEVAFFGRETAARLAADGTADLLIGNNVLAHVPALNDFVAGLKIMLGPTGVLTMEFPHVLRLIDEAQFDTIYHEHFSYFSFITARRVLEAHALRVFDVEEIATHGGSLRIYAAHADDASHRETKRPSALAARESEAGLAEAGTYVSFGEAVQQAKRETLAYFIEAKREGKRIVGYGAPAKGNTFLNYCGIRTDFIDYTVDLSPHKQGLFLPGTHIPIKAPEEIRRTRPDLVFILPWNIRDEIMEQMSFIRDWGGRFAVSSPQIEVSA